MKNILIIIFFLLFNSTSYAKIIYLNCEETIQKVRETTYESLYVEGEIIGNAFVKIKSKTIDIHYAYPGGEIFELIINKKFKKTTLGFTVKDKYKDAKFKTEEFFEFVKPLDDYVFQRSSYFWNAETSTDGENVSDYDGSARCETIEKKEYSKLIK
jgi:hypothetical protein